MDRDPLQPIRSAPPDPLPLGDLAEQRPLRVVPAPPSPLPPKEGPPFPGRGAGGTGQPSLERLRRELEVTREEIRHLHEMTLELPEIFENKFRQRLRETLGQQRLLLEENASLKRKLLELGSASSPGLRPLLLPPARSEKAEPRERHARPGLMRSLRQAWVGLVGRKSGATLKGDEPTRDGLADPRHK